MRELFFGWLSKPRLQMTGLDEVIMTAEIIIFIMICLGLFILVVNKGLK